MSGEVERFNAILSSMAAEKKMEAKYVKLLRMFIGLIKSELNDDNLHNICVALRDHIVPFVLGEKSEGQLRAEEEAVESASRV